MDYDKLLDSLNEYDVGMADIEYEIGVSIWSYVLKRGMTDFDHFKKALKLDCVKKGISFMNVWKAYRVVRLDELNNDEVPISVARELSKSDLEDELKLDLVKKAEANHWGSKEVRSELRKYKDKVIGIEGREIKGLYSDMIVDIKNIRKRKGVDGLRIAKEKLKEI